jgi:hypothetical protein
LLFQEKEMFPTLTFRVEESSRFSPSGLENAQDSLTFRVEECSRFSLLKWFPRFSIARSEGGKKVIIIRLLL